MEKTKTYIESITRDISDGLILIDKAGNILYANPSACRLLANDSLNQGITFDEFMKSDVSGKNGEFRQFVLDSLSDKKRTDSGHVSYTCHDGTRRTIRMTKSSAAVEGKPEPLGVILQLADVTEQRRKETRYTDAVKILVAIIFLLATWDFACVIWDMLGKPIAASTMTVIIEVLGLIGTVFALRYTSVTPADFGLGTKNLKASLRFDLILTAAILVLMIGAKLVILKFFPDVCGSDTRLFYWDKWSRSMTFYPLTVLIQEFLTRGATQGSLEKVLPENYPPWVAVIISSVFFGALHVHRGLAYMIGATVLLSFFGFVYNKQRTIWGLCIPHYFLGISLTLIWGFA